MLKDLVIIVFVFPILNNRQTWRGTNNPSQYWSRTLPYTQHKVQAEHCFLMNVKCQFTVVLDDKN